MRSVVDAALAGGSLSVTAIRRDEVPDDGWADLAGLLDEFTACRATLDTIEADLRAANLDDLIQKDRPR